MFYTVPTYQFDQGDYVESEGSGYGIVVNVQQIVSSVQDIHLLTRYHSPRPVYCMELTTDALHYAIDGQKS